MDQHKSDETTLLLGHDHKYQPSPASLKFPLGLVSPTVRPYLELIRLEKVSFFLFIFRYQMNRLPVANRNHPIFLAVWYVVVSSNVNDTESIETSVGPYHGRASDRDISRRLCCQCWEMLYLRISTAQLRVHRKRYLRP